jgi:RES domain-containing protein
MIVTALGPLAAYRMHLPKWASMPISGAGAAAHGGRANGPGTHALYLALDPATAIREYQQASTLLPPGTLVTYTVELAKVVDFRAKNQDSLR